MPYPLMSDARGTLHTQTGISQVKSDLLSLLLTNPGERVFLPMFGTPLRKLVFEQNDINLIGEAKAMIVNSITSWEPRITVDAIEVTNGLEEDSRHSDDDLTEQGAVLGIKIMFFDPESILDLQELTLELPLGGSGAAMARFGTGPVKTLDVAKENKNNFEFPEL